MKGELDQGKRDQGETSAQLPNGGETILLVEDEDAVRVLIYLILQSRGYTVLVADRGENALDVARTHPGDIHLLLTDVVMPGWNGRQLAEHLAQIRPQVKDLYMSGFIDDSIIRHGMMQAGMPFLPKPFSAAMLTQKVRTVLDAN